MLLEKPVKIQLLVYIDLAHKFTIIESTADLPSLSHSRPAKFDGCKTLRFHKNFLRNLEIYQKNLEKNQTIY